MKKRVHKILGALFALALFVSCLVPVSVAAAETEVELFFEEWFELEGLQETEERYESEYESADTILEENLANTGMSLSADQRVYDFYGLFSGTESEEIESLIRTQEEESGISIRVFVAEMSMNEEKAFLEECADALCDGGFSSEDLAIMLLNLDYFDRGVCIQGYGLCEERVNDDRIEYILDDIIEWFSHEDYVYGVELFAREAAYYAGSDDYATYYKDTSVKAKLHRMPWGLIVIAPAVVTLIGILSMKGSGGGKMTTNGMTYIQSGVSGLTANKDDYVRTSVSKTYSPQSSGSSGGRSGGGRSSGGGGRSSGGRSHSGGSRRF